MGESEAPLARAGTKDFTDADNAPLLLLDLPTTASSITMRQLRDPLNKSNAAEV